MATKPMPQGQLNVTGAIGSGDYQTMQQLNAGPAKQYDFMDYLGYSIPATAVGFIDEVAQTFDFVDDKQLTETTKQIWPGLGQFYETYKDAYQTAGSLVGMLIPGQLAVKAFRGGSRVHKLFESLSGGKNKYLNSVFSSGKSYDQLMASVRARDMYLARRGVSDFTMDPIRNAFKRQAINTKMLDSVKETLAFEAGVYSTMNASETLYPEEMTFIDHATLGAAGVGIFGGVERLVMGRLLRQSIERAGVVAGKVNDPMNLAVSARIQMPFNAQGEGGRDAAATIEALYMNHAKKEIDEYTLAEGQKIILSSGETSQSFGLRKKILDGQAKSYEASLENTLQALAKDKPFKTLTSSGELSESQMIAAKKAAQDDATVFIGATSIEPKLFDREAVEAWYKKKEKRIEELKTTIADMQANKNVLTMQDDIAKLQKELHETNIATPYIVEPDGTLNLAKGRKDMYQDGDRKISLVPGKDIDPDVWTVHIEAPLFGTKERIIGASEDFHILLPQMKEETLFGVTETKQKNLQGLTKVVAEQDLYSANYFKNILKDFGEDWALGSHRGEREIYSKMSSEFRNAIEGWHGSSNSGGLRDWYANDPAKFRQFYNANEPARKRLWEIAGSNGVIPLFRGEKISSLKNTKVDLVSMTSNPETAKEFGEQVVVRFVSPDDVVAVTGGLGEWEFIVKNNQKRIFEDEVIYEAGKTNVEKVAGKFGKIAEEMKFLGLDYGKATAAYAALQHSIEKYKGASLTFGNNEPFYRLDAFVQLLRNKPDEAQKIWTAASKPDRWMSVDDVMLDSIQKKFNIYKAMKKFSEKQNNTTLKLPENIKLQYRDMIKILNLAPSDALHANPVLQLFDSWEAAGLHNVRDTVKDMPSFHKLLEMNTFLPELTMPLGRKIDVMGKMLAIPKDARPFGMIKRNVRDVDYTRDALMNKQQIQWAERVAAFRLAASSGATFVRQAFDVIEGLAATKTAKEVEQLAEGSQRGSGAVLTQPYAAGENPVLQAMNLLVSLHERQARKLAEALFKPALQDFSFIRAAANRADYEAFTQFVHARRMGWDLDGATSVVQLPGGKQGTVFHLTDSNHNKEIWQRTFNEPMPNINKEQGKHVYMSIPSGSGGQVPAVLTELGMKVQGHVARIYDNLWANNNYLKQMAGKGKVNKKEFYVPPKNLARQNVIFIVANDKEKAGELLSIAHGPTRGAAEEHAAAQKAAFEKNGRSVYTVDRENMSMYFELQDKAFETMLDFTDPLAQTGKATGKSVGPLIERGEDILSDIIDTANRQIESVMRRSRMLYFEPQMKYARQIAGQVNPAGAKKGQDVWHRYISMMLGNPTLNPRDMIGKLYYGLESIYDDTLNVLFDRVREYKHPAGFTRTHVTKDEEKAYKAIKDTLGDFSPFKTAVEYANNTYRVALPPSMKAHMSKLNNVTTLLTLRLLDVGHSILNMTSLAATMPAVIKALNRSRFETPEDHAARIAAFGIKPSKDTGMFSPIRATVSGVHYMFSKEGQQIWKEAAELGYFRQDVAEILKTLTAPRLGYHERMIARATDTLSFLSDKSEELSRAIAFMTAVNIGKRGLKIQEKKNLYAFAHDFANKVVGDYRPNSRPRIFQGAVGMPLGLFTTFMQNYYQRMFGYIENKQIGALATQYAMQGSIFGAESVPGFTQFNDFFASNYDGSVNPVDGLRSRFGDEAADWLLYGTLSNLPKLFGANDGIALYSRGDMNVTRIPGLWNFENTPSYQVMAKAYGALRDSATQLAQNGFSLQQQMEIFAQYSVSRSLKNMIEVFGTGYSTDAVGQVISNDVSSGMSLVAKMMGLRPMSEAKNVEIAYKIRTGELQRREKMSNLREFLRSSIRGGELDEETLMDAFNDYIQYGGSPENFTSWIAENTIAATQDRNARKFVELLRSKNPNMTDMQRLMSSYSLFPNDPEFEE